MRLTRFLLPAWILAVGSYWASPGFAPRLDAASWLPASKEQEGRPGASTRAKRLAAPEKAAAQGLSAFSVPAGSEPYPSRWVGGDSGQSIPYLVDGEALPDGLSLEEALAAVDRAFSAWEAACGLHFHLEAVTPFGGAADLVPNRDGRIRIQLHDLHERILDPGLAAFGGLLTTSEPFGVGSGGRVFHQEFHRTTGGYVIVNHRQSIFSDVATIEEVLAHEIGHALGLAHSSEDPGEEDPELREALMYGVVHGDGRGAQLSDWDASVLARAYPDVSPPPAFSSSLEAPTAAAGVAVLFPELLRVPVHRGPAGAGSGTIPWSVRLYSARTTSQYGEFHVEDGDIVYNPIGFFQLPLFSPDSGRSHDRALFRVESELHGSALEWVHVLGLRRDGWGQSPDGLPDAWVREWFGEGVVVDAHEDSDGDGCSEMHEYIQGTNPLDPASCVRLSLEALPPSIGEAAGLLELALDCGQPLVRPIAVRLEWSGTATRGSDYRLPERFASGVVIPPGFQHWSVPITLIDDDLSEGTELLRVEIMEVLGAGLEERISVETMILDNEELPVYALVESSLVVREGDPAGVPVRVLRSGRVDAPSCVRIAAHAAAEEAVLDPMTDLGALGWDLCFEGGETEAVFWLAPVDDAVAETAEWGFLRLEAVEGGGIIDLQAGEASLQVLDNDGEPEITASAVPAQEGEPYAEVVLRLSHPSDSPVVVHYRFEGGSAREGDDFLPASGAWEIAPGELEGRVYAALVDDPWSENEEEFFFLATAVEGGTVSMSRIAIRLLDDEGLASLLTPAKIHAGEGQELDVLVSLSGPSAEAVEFAWRFVGRTESTAGDAPVESGVLRFTPGQTAGMVSIQLPDDDLDEPEESIYLEWTGSLRAQPGPFITEIVIADNDPRPLLLVEDVVYQEGDAQAPAPFRLSGASGFEVTVQVSIAAGSAISGSDYLLSRSLVSIPPGVVHPEWPFQVIDDFRHEASKECEVRIGIVRNAVVSRTRALLTLVDDDPPDALMLKPAVALERDGPVRAELLRSTLRDTPLLVEYRTISGTAAPSFDYEHTDGVAVFEAESWSTFIEVTLLDDTLDEDAEIFEIEVTNSGGYTAASNRSPVTIEDDDPEPVLQGGWSEAPESEGTATMILTLSEPSGRTVRGFLAPIGGTATPGEDFAAGPFPFQLPPGQQVAEVQIAVLDDSIAEETETVFLDFEALENALRGSGELGFAIVDDDEILDEKEQLVLERKAGGGLRVRWRGRRGGTYEIERSLDLRSWEEWPGFHGDATGDWLETEIDRDGFPVRFLRLKRREEMPALPTLSPQAREGDSG